MAVLYGKGPSLWRHDFSQDPIVRAAVNDAGYCVPNLTYHFMHDAVSEAHDVMAETLKRSRCVTFVLPNSFKNIVEETWRVIWYESTWVLDPRKVPYEKLQLWCGSGTAHSAFQFLWITGIPKIRLVGFDGKVASGYAEHYPITKSCREKDLKKDALFEKHANINYARNKRILHGMGDILGVTVEDRY